jgi:drug/metabolite transporter (DMT)-like permease
MSPLFVGACRAVVAALLATAALASARQRLPRGSQWPRLAVVVAGIVIGFPVLTSFALMSASAGHGAVLIALLPAATAAMAAARGHERPPLSFWVLAAVGAVAAVAFGAVRDDGLGGLHWSDLLLLGAVLAGAVGYAEGGLLARELGAWQTISWALVLALPLTLVLACGSALQHTPSAPPAAWAAFGYLAVVSMFGGFVAWYRGLAIGPIARVSQIQLVQPVMTICWAALLLGERLTWATVLGGAVVIACAAATVRMRLEATHAEPPGPACVERST